MEYYNNALPTVPKTAVKWFGYKNNQVKTRIKNGRAAILTPYPYLVSITNLILSLMLLSYLLMKGWQYTPSFNKSILLAGFASIVYAGFIILTCAAALRFQAFQVVLSVTFSLLLIDWMARLMQRMKHESQQQQPSGEYAQKAEVV
jgi:membrane protein implicated in regulation of membrane protease activity